MLFENQFNYNELAFSRRYFEMIDMCGIFNVISKQFSCIYVLHKDPMKQYFLYRNFVICLFYNMYINMLSFALIQY